MSISIKNKSTGLIQEIQLESDLITITYLKKLIGLKYSLPYQNLQSNLKIFTRDDAQRQYEEQQFVKKGERIQFLFIDSRRNSEQLKKEKDVALQKKKLGIISPQQLQAIIQDSKVYMIKSANEQNIQKAKDFSFWATTFSNQERLKYSFNTSKHVLLLFATNRSFQIKGLARMESEPEKNADKSLWVGVTNIRLGGNFKIKWLRKKPLSLVNVQKSMGNLFKQSILRSCDGQQIDPISCKPLAYLFEVPTQPFYPPGEIQQTLKQKTSQKKSQPFNNMNFMPPFFMPPSMGLFQNQIIHQTNLSLGYPSIDQIENRRKQSDKISFQVKCDKKKQSKKDKKHSKQKKIKKSKKKYLTSSQSQSDSRISESSSSKQSSSYSSSQRSYNKDRKKKKDKKMQRNKKKSAKKDKRSKKDRKKDK